MSKFIDPKDVTVGSGPYFVTGIKRSVDDIQADPIETDRRSSQGPHVDNDDCPRCDRQMVRSFYCIKCGYVPPKNDPTEGRIL